MRISTGKKKRAEVARVEDAMFALLVINDQHRYGSGRWGSMCVTTTRAGREVLDRFQNTDALYSATASDLRKR